MYKHIPVIAIACAILWSQSGCLSPITNPPKIMVARSGQLTVDGQAVQVEQLGKKLKSMGVPITAPILVSVYKDMPRVMESNIARPLIAAGYRKFMFVTPKEVVVSTATITPTVSSSSTTQTTARASSSTRKQSSRTTGL